MEAKRMLKYQINPRQWRKIKKALRLRKIRVKRLGKIQFGTSLIIDVPEDLLIRVSKVIGPKCNR
jgi:hypothetical protein